MARITIFLKHDMLIFCESRKHMRLEDCIDIDSLRHLTVRIAWDVVEYDIAFVIPSNHGPAMKTLDIVGF